MGAKDGMAQNSVNLFMEHIPLIDWLALAAL